MNHKRRLKKELAKIETPSIEKILKNTEKRGNDVPQRSKRKHLAIAPTVAILLSIAIIGCSAFSIPIIIEHLNAKALTENNKQLSYVPDGYIGIYTAQDLDNIRNAPAENYILMDDITFSESDFLEGGQYEGGWIPIGNEKDSSQTSYFKGIFNGNGHVINNVKISTDGATEAFGIFGNTRGYFINLGIKNLDLTLNTSNISDTRVGAIAATATFVGGCYLKGSNITITIGDSSGSLCVGGIVGVSEHIDSCISYADISIVGANENNVYAGFCAGRTLSVITSVGIGNVKVNNTAIDNVAVVSTTDIMPTMLSIEAMNKLLEQLDQYYDGNSFYKTKLKAMYFSLDQYSEHEEQKKTYQKYLEINKHFEFIDGNTSDILLSERSRFNVEYNADLSGAIIKAFGGYESFIDFCAQNGIKCGAIHCYTFENENDMNVETLEGFDFENIFIKKDKKLSLRIFE